MTYKETHPWISFRLNLSRCSPDFWILTGEAKSKCEHIASVPLKPETAKKLHTVYLVKGVRGTVAIEGNTLSEDQVQLRLKGDLPLPQSQEYLGTEVDNIVQAINQIGVLVKASPKLSLDLIKEFNRLVLKGLKCDEGVMPGEIRKSSFGVGHYRGAPANECECLLIALCDWLNGPDFVPPTEGQDKTIITAIIKAIIAHLYIEWIHPFGDGNGRTGRLIEFYILVMSGIPSPAAHLLSNHYNLTRSEYYRQLDQSSKSGGDVLPFLMYALQGFVDGLREQLADIRRQQWALAWQNYVHEQLAETTDTRRRHLVLDLSKKAKPVSFDQIREVSARVAREYATKSSRTLMRDLEKLEDLNLIVVDGEGYRAKQETILAFLPFRHDPVETVKEV